TSSRLAASCLTARTASTRCDRRHLTSTGFYAVTNRPIFRCRRRQGSRRSLISRPPRRLALRCLLVFFWLPTRSSNSRVDVTSWHFADMTAVFTHVHFRG